MAIRCQTPRKTLEGKFGAKRGKSWTEISYIRVDGPPLDIVKWGKRVLVCDGRRKIRFCVYCVCFAYFLFRRWYWACLIHIVLVLPSSQANPTSFLKFVTPMVSSDAISFSWCEQPPNPEICVVIPGKSIHHHYQNHFPFRVSLRTLYRTNISIFRFGRI